MHMWQNVEWQLHRALCFTKANSISLRMSLKGNPYGEREEQPDLNLITVQ